MRDMKTYKHTRLDELIDVSHFPGGVTGTVTIQTGYLCQKTDIEVSVRAASLSSSPVNRISAQFEEYAISGDQKVNVTSRASEDAFDASESPLDLAINIYTRPFASDDRCYITVNAKNLNISLAHGTGFFKGGILSLTATDGNIHNGMSMFDHLVWQTRAAYVKSIHGSITGYWAMRPHLDLDAGKSVDVEIEPFLLGNGGITHTNLTITSGGDTTVKTTPRLKSDVMMDGSINIYSKKGSIRGNAVHGAFTSITTAEGDIDITLYPYSDPTDTFAPSLLTSSGGNSNILVDFPDFDEFYKYNPLNRTISNHAAGGWLNLRYPGQWGGTATIESTNGTVSVDGSNLEFVIHTKSYAVAKRKGESQLDAKAVKNVLAFLG
ncbi:hypothetical protein ABW19_dt0202378 [Dactylella cylindrospora]|nr:hypothetical protein ABW19_dt0202378 [Dactylella cylindrospora]